MSINKTDIEKARGIQRFLIPVEVLPNELELRKIGSTLRLELRGQLVEIEGKRFLSTYDWRVNR